MTLTPLSSASAKLCKCLATNSPRNDSSSVAIPFSVTSRGSPNPRKIFEHSLQSVRIHLPADFAEWTLVIMMGQLTGTAENRAQAPSGAVDDRSFVIIETDEIEIFHRLPPSTRASRDEM